VARQIPVQIPDLSHCIINSNFAVVYSTHSECVAERRSTGVLKLLTVGVNEFAQLAKQRV
jgi:hypothetical protein